jgi:hypothetical protein
LATSNIDPEIAHHRAVRAAHVRWSKPEARSRQADAISEARIRVHEDRVDPDRTLPPQQRRKLAENSLRAEMAGLALKAAKARRKGGDSDAA